MPTIANLKRWRNGEIFNARDYVYERDTVIAQVNRLSALLEGTSTPVDLTVDNITASSITMGPKTINNFNELGINSYLDGDEPTGYDVNEGDLWFDTTP
jgi:hypothetical protein